MSVLLLIITAFPFLSHPMAIGLNLLFSTVLISLLLGVSRINFWVSYTLLLILTGGLLVIFVYISLLASNEKFKRRWALRVVLLCRGAFMLLVFLNLDIDFGPDLNNPMEYFLKPLYNTELYRFTIFIVLYLLLTLLVVVHNTKKDSFPLRRIKN